MDQHPFELLAAFDRIDHPPRGQNGGAAGAAGRVALASGQPLRGKGIQDIAGDARLHILTPGGGGSGAPFERDPTAVRDDVLDELVSRQAAARLYGVVISDAGEIDWAATRATRAG